MQHDVLVFVECRAGTIKRASLEALSEGRRLSRSLGGKLLALLAVSGPDIRLAELAPMSPDRILVATHEIFAEYQPEAYAAVVAQAVRESQAGWVLLSAT